MAALVLFLVALAGCVPAPDVIDPREAGGRRMLILRKVGYKPLLFAECMDGSYRQADDLGCYWDDRDDG